MLRVVSVVVALQLATTQVFANTSNVWQGSDGNWSDGGNWLNQSPPGSVDTAEINTGVTVTLDTDPSVFGLIISSSAAKLYGDSQLRTLSVADSFQWSDGEIGTNASVTVLNNGTIDGPVEMRQRALRVEDTLNQTNGGQITAISGTSNRVTVRSTGIYNLQQHNNVFIGDTAGAMVIEAGGKFSKNSNTGISYVNWPFTNAGTVEVQTGTLAFRDSGQFTGSQSISNGDTGRFYRVVRE